MPFDNTMYLVDAQGAREMTRVHRTALAPQNTRKPIRLIPYTDWQANREEYLSQGLCLMDVWSLEEVIPKEI
jgi:hypothetical protein